MQSNPTVGCILESLWNGDEKTRGQILQGFQDGSSCHEFALRALDRMVKLHFVEVRIGDEADQAIAAVQREHETERIEPVRFTISAAKITFAEISLGKIVPLTINDIAAWMADVETRRRVPWLERLADFSALAEAIRGPILRIESLDVGQFITPVKGLKVLGFPVVVSDPSEDDGDPDELAPEVERETDMKTPTAEPEPLRPLQLQAAG